MVAKGLPQPISAIVVGPALARLKLVYVSLEPMLCRYLCLGRLHQFWKFQLQPELYHELNEIGPGFRAYHLRFLKKLLEFDL